MSAFVCNENHIKALAIYATGIGEFGQMRVVVDVDKLPNRESFSSFKLRRLQLANFYANCMYSQNLRSVQFRYENEFKSIADLINKYQLPEKIEITINDMTKSWVKNPLWIIKMANCLEYQSCETEDWKETLSYKIIDSIRRCAITELPGYEQAPWELK